MADVLKYKEPKNFPRVAVPSPTRQNRKRRSTNLGLQILNVLNSGFMEPKVK